MMSVGYTGTNVDVWPKVLAVSKSGLPRPAAVRAQPRAIVGRRLCPASLLQHRASFEKLCDLVSTATRSVLPKIHVWVRSTLHKNTWSMAGHPYEKHLSSCHRCTRSLYTQHVTNIPTLKLSKCSYDTSLRTSAQSFRRLSQLPTTHFPSTDLNVSPFTVENIAPLV